MKRDLDLVREILFKMEAAQKGSFAEHEFKSLLPERDHDVIRHHLQIMSQADLIHINRPQPISGGNLLTQYVASYYSIHWQGHEFIATMRDDNIWKKVKDVMAKAGGFAFDLAILTAKELIKDAIKRQLQ